jgi:hypothetical protein
MPLPPGRLVEGNTVNLNRSVEALSGASCGRDDIHTIKSVVIGTKGRFWLYVKS